MHLLYLVLPCRLPLAMQGWSQSCLCGRIFTQTYAYTNHSRNCKKTKTRLSDALEKAKERHYANKRRKTEVMQSEATGSPRLEEAVQAEAPGSPVLAAVFPSNDAPPPDSTHHVRSSAWTIRSALFKFLFCQNENSMDDETLHISLAELRTRREHRQPPKRYLDMLPEPPPALPPPCLPEDAQTDSNEPQPLSQQSQVPASLADRKVLKSGCNGFGLFRQYFVSHLPDHDPGGRITRNDLIESPNPSRSVHPYPNLSSFLIGKWYWNGGERKSQASLEQLVKIIGHPEFRPKDVAGNNWQLIDAQLSGERSEDSNKEDDWENEQVNQPEGWIKTPIKIKVPFHKMKHPGQKEFDSGILHHHRLMSVIRERITRPSVHPHLHFEPYKLFWQPNVAAEPI